MQNEISQCWSCKSVFHVSELMVTEDGKDCPVHKYLEHIGEFGTERYKKYMRDNYAKEE